MDNINHLNSEYYGLPVQAKERTNKDSEFASTLCAVAVIVFFTILAAIVC